MDISKGYVRLFRQIVEWEWYDNPFVKAIFFHCLISANDKAKKWRDINLKRGQFATSYEKLAAVNGLTIQQTRTALKQLQVTNEIECQSTNQYTVITVKNYNLYQAANTQKSEANSTPTNKRNGGQLTTTNNINIKSIDLYNTHTKEKSVCEKISSEDMKILRKYAKENGARNIKPYVNKLIENGGYIDILKEEKSRMEKEKQRAQRYEIKSEVPPKKNEEPPADIQILRDNLKFIKPKGEKKNG